MKVSELLPVGSVVKLKGGEKRLMIYGINQISKEDSKEYDYVACCYPEGNMGAEYNYVFNHEDIEKVNFFGFIDAEFQVFRARLNSIENEREEKE